ncbi:hypothetical protein, partial [Stenotrophomonas maltophilia]
ALPGVLVLFLVGLIGFSVMHLRLQRDETLRAASAEIESFTRLAAHALKGESGLSAPALQDRLTQLMPPEAALAGRRLL